MIRYEKPHYPAIVLNFSYFDCNFITKLHLNMHFHKQKPDSSDCFRKMYGRAC